MTVFKRSHFTLRLSFLSAIHYVHTLYSAPQKMPDAQ